MRTGKAIAPLLALMLALPAWAHVAPRDAGPARSDSLARRLARLVNEHRATLGCPPLAWDPDLATVAFGHSMDMATRGFFGHTNPDGETPTGRLRSAFIGYAKAAENIAAGYASPDSVLAAWLRSPRHRRNLEDCAFTRHGVGLFRNRWTHVYVRPSARSSP